jgi:tetratricopeptide (TPR) repeat protein
LRNRLPYKLRITGRCGLIIVFFIQVFNASAQINPTYDLQKPKAFENRKLASELTPEKKINPVKRAKQNIVTHYNFHFNARNKLEKVIRNAKTAHQDTFTQLLTVFNYSLENTAQQQQELDSVILKCNNGILLHDLRNDWVDDLYLLMGQSYFYQKKFDSAYDVFQFINYNFQPRNKDEAGMEKSIGSNLNNSGNVYTVSSKEKKISPHQSVRNDALLWIARTLLELGQTDEARGMLETLSRDKLFPNRLYNELSETKGDWFYRVKQYDSAAYYLKKSVAKLENAGEKSRRYYLIAQLLVMAGQNEAADSSFEKSISLTTNPVMDAYAKISQIGLVSASKAKETRISENIDALMTMAKKEKYAAYRGIIYAAAAQIEKSRNHNTEAINFLIRSNVALANDANAKNTNSIEIAELAFESKDYPLAKRYFDSSNITGHVREKQMTIKKSVVTDLVKFLSAVSHEDSLQKIAALPERERNELLAEMLKKIEKENSGLLPERKNIGQAVQRSRFPEDQTGSLFPAAQQKGEWYFNNATLKTQGIQAFQQKWGNRPNEDNWRRSTSGSATARPITSRSRIVQQQAVTEDDTPSIEKLARDLPLSIKSLQESNARKANAARQLALIYKNKLGDCASSVQWNETLLQSNSNHPELELVLFDLAICCKETGLTDKSNRYLAQLEQVNPSGELLQKLRNPELSAKKVNEKSNAATETYQKIYDQFLSGDFTAAVTAKKNADSVYGQTAWSPQLMYIEAVYYIKSREDSIAITTLNIISKRFPSSPLAQKAVQLADVVRRRNEIEKELTSMSVVRVKEDSISLGDNSQLLKKIDPSEKTVKPVEPAVKNQVAAIESPVRDSSKLKLPELAVLPAPVQNDRYTFNANAPHAVIMLMNNVDIVYINEAKRALVRYHSIKYPENEYTVNNDKIGNTPFIIISFFQNAAEAVSYFDQTVPIASKEIFPWLPGDKYKMYILSPDHLKTMMEEEKTDNFIKFIKTQFPGKF